MPTCETCHPTAVALAHTGSAVRDLGFAGALSTAAASMLAIGYKRRVSDRLVGERAEEPELPEGTHVTG